MTLTRSALPDATHGQQKGKIEQEIHPRKPFRDVSLCVPGNWPLGANRRGLSLVIEIQIRIILMDGHIRLSGQPYVERQRPASVIGLQSVDSPVDGAIPWWSPLASGVDFLHLSLSSPCFLPRRHRCHDVSIFIHCLNLGNPLLFPWSKAKDHRETRIRL